MGLNWVNNTLLIKQSVRGRKGATLIQTVGQIILSSHMNLVLLVNNGVVSLPFLGYSLKGGKGKVSKQLQSALLQKSNYISHKIYFQNSDCL